MRSEVLNSRNFVWMAFFLLATLFFAGAVPAHAQTNSRGLPDFSDLVDRVGPAVVNIRTTQKVSQNPQGFPGFPGMDPNDPFFEFFRRFMPPGTPMPGQPGQAPRGGQQAPWQQEQLDVPRLSRLSQRYGDQAHAGHAGGHVPGRSGRRCVG